MSFVEHMTIIDGDRTKFIGGTDARVIAEGTGWHQLYLEKTGQAQRPDLSHVWKPRLGLETEKLHAWWHQQSENVTLADPFGDKPVTRASLPAHHACTIDRVVMVPDMTETLLEMKHTSERLHLRDRATYYMAQLQWQLHVCDLPSLRFSIIRGNNEPEWGLVERDQAYIDKLIEQVDAFWWHVTEGVAPDPDPEPKAASRALKAAAAQVPLNGFRPYDMTGNNEFADAAATFIRDKVGAESLKDSEKAIRAMIPADAETVTGYGVTFKRDARGAYRCTIDEAETEAWRAMFATIRTRAGA
jgi:predicted phage-related endonuclease